MGPAIHHDSHLDTAETEFSLLAHHRDALEVGWRPKTVLGGDVDDRGVVRERGRHATHRQVALLLPVPWKISADVSEEITCTYAVVEFRFQGSGRQTGVANRHAAWHLVYSSWRLPQLFDNFT